MKKSILVILLVLLAFSLWSVLAFGKAKKDEGVKKTEEVKAEPAPVEFPEVVLPKPHPVRPTQEDFENTLMERKNKTPEDMKALQGETVPTEFEPAVEKAPYFCRVRNQVGGAYYQPDGNPYLYCWGQLGLATLLNLDHNYFTDCPYPLYPFGITDLLVLVYAADTATIVSEARIYDVDYSTGCQYPNAQISPPGGPQIDAHPGGFYYIDVPLPDTACVYDEFFAAWMFNNSDDFMDEEHCTPVNTVAALSLIFDISGRTCQSYWGPYSEITGEPYYGWFDVVPNGMWSGALRIEVYGYTADQNTCPPPPETWYFKDPYLPGAPCGMPDFNQYQMPGPAFCGPTAGANSIWWFASRGDFPPSWGGLTPADVPVLIDEIATASGTDPNQGTECDSLQDGIINTIWAHGGWWFYEKTEYAPDFWYIQKELRDCEDVILLLGFWQTPDGGATWQRFGGHFVTLAGVDIYNLAFAFSDPAQDLAETGGSAGVVCGTHTPANDPLDHNTGPASHDFHPVAWPSDSPGGYVWLPDYYANWPDFQGQNFRTEHLPYAGTYNPALPVIVEVEQAIVVSPGPKFMKSYVEGSQVYEEDNNYGGIADAEWEVNFNGDGVTWVNGGYYGSYILGTSQADINCSYGDLSITNNWDPLAAPVQDTFTIAGAAGNYDINQLTLKFKHSLYDIFITEYVFGIWVPAGGTKDCELAIEHVFVLENQGATAVTGLQSGIINDVDIGGNACLMDYDAVHNSMWMYEVGAETLNFGMTKKPAIVGDYAITGWGLSNPARIYDGNYVDSLFDWMQSRTWQLDDVGTGDDMSFLLADVPFDLQPGQVRIEKWLKWGYPGVIGAGGDADWRHFLYNILHQEGFYRGDVNKDGKLDVSDVIFTINYLYKGGPTPIEFKNQGDVNCDGNTDISDVIYTINYLFKGGPAPIDKNRFFLESPYVDPAHKAAYIERNPGLFGDPDWKTLGQ